MFYDPQKVREELIGDEITQDEEFMDNSIAQNRSLRRIHSHTELVRILFEFASQNKHFTLSDLWNYILENSDIGLLCEEKRFIHDILSVYETGIIDVDKWRNESGDRYSDDIYDEFDLSEEMRLVEEEHPDMYNVKKINIFTGDNEMAIHTTFMDAFDMRKYVLEAHINNMNFEVEE